jgi:hypothetical protein
MIRDDLKTGYPPTLRVIVDLACRLVSHFQLLQIKGLYFLNRDNNTMMTGEFLYCECDHGHNKITSQLRPGTIFLTLHSIYHHTSG